MEWLAVGKKLKMSELPHCIGTFGGKHVQLQAPVGTGSDFFNYKSTFSIVLVVDADYNFLYADVGCQGRFSDGRVLNTKYVKFRFL